VKVLQGKTYILEQDDPRYTIPIPRDAIAANPGLAN
jgi:starch-binding outer membrane protein, SusD/RagB family